MKVNSEMCRECENIFYDPLYGVCPLHMQIVNGLSLIESAVLKAIGKEHTVGYLLSDDISHHALKFDCKFFKERK